MIYNGSSIQLSAPGANFLFVAQGRVLIGKGALVQYKHQNVVSEEL